jgi:hypothetical protein
VQHIDIGSPLGEFGECHSGDGHRGFLQIKLDASRLALSGLTTATPIRTAAAAWQTTLRKTYTAS